MFRVKSSRRRVIRDCEWIEGILNRHANACATYSEWMSRIREYIRSKWSRRQGAVPETAHVFEVSKKLQVLIANFAVERAVEVFTIHWGHCRCESVEVKELVASRGRLESGAYCGSLRYVWKCVRRGCQRAAVKARLVNEVSDTSGKVARPIIRPTKTGEVIAFEEMSRSRL